MSEPAAPAELGAPLSPRRQLLAAVVLSACLGLVFGAGAAWAIYQRLGPASTVSVPVAPASGNGRGAAGGQGQTYGSLAAAAQPSLVRIVTRPISAPDLVAGTSGLATGFVVSQDGLVVTSAHALRGATRLQLVLPGGQVVEASVAGSDPVHGIAVLRAAAIPSDARPQPLSFTDFAHSPPRPGDLAIAVGVRTPGGLSVVPGTVSAVGRSLQTEAAASEPCGALLGVLVVNAAPDPEDDGAPLLDASGHVVGVVTAVESSGAASPSGLLALDGRGAADLVDDLGHGRTGARPTLGMQSSPIDAATAGAVRARPGALVVCVVPGGAGELAGIRPGDVVTSADGGPIDADHPLDAAALHLSPGQRIGLTVVRGGRESSVVLSVGASGATAPPG